MDHQGIAGLLDIPRNRPTDGTQTDKSYQFHFSTS
jgi:hypothetical protein